MFRSWRNLPKVALVLRGTDPLVDLSGSKLFTTVRKFIIAISDVHGVIHHT